MGFLDSLLSIVSEWHPEDLAAGGIIGASMMANLRKQVEERAQRPKPGVFCRSVCMVCDERCTPCLALQQVYGDLISQMEKLEEMENLTTEQVQQLTRSKKITKCSLCGAPFEKGNKECPYCSTPYPEDGIDFDIPLSKQERRALVLKKAEEAWNVYMQFSTLISQYLKDTAGDDWVGKFQKFAGGMAVSAQGMMKHSVAELQQGASHYGVSLSQYLYCIGTDEMKPLKVLEAQEANRRRAEEQQRRNAEFQQLMAQRQTQNQQQMAQMQTQRKPCSGLDLIQRHNEMSSGPGYRA